MALAKKTKKVNALVDRSKAYSLEDAVAILKQAAGERKFAETIEIAMNLGVDPRKNDQVVRGVVDAAMLAGIRSHAVANLDRFNSLANGHNLSGKFVS